MEKSNKSSFKTIQKTQNISVNAGAEIEKNGENWVGWKYISSDSNLSLRESSRVCEPLKAEYKEYATEGKCRHTKAYFVPLDMNNIAKNVLSF